MKKDFYRSEFSLPYYFWVTWLEDFLLRTDEDGMLTQMWKEVFNLHIGLLFGQNSTYFAVLQNRLKKIYVIPRACPCYTRIVYNCIILRNSYSSGLLGIYSLFSRWRYYIRRALLNYKFVWPWFICSCLLRRTCIQPYTYTYSLVGRRTWVKHSWIDGLLSFYFWWI